ncbi:MAG: DegT/DnrJ/EryC1/StrS family aminotransferase, partial [Candidatus Hodarchaeota archaeon]
LLEDDGVDRKELKTKLREKYDVSLSGEVYETPCHQQPIFRDLPGSQGEFPIATKFCVRHICLPIFPTMTEEQALYVVNSLKKELG